MSQRQNIYKEDAIWNLAKAGKPMNKFVQMHEFANILHDHRNNAKKKLDAMQLMILAQDTQTRDHFRAALTQVLRDEKNASVRHEAIKQLGIYFTWSEIEWTFWLHEKRQPKDIQVLTVYEWYAQNKTLNRLDANLLLRAVKEMAA